MTTPQSPTLDELRDWHYRRKALADIGKPFSEMPWAEQHWDTDFMRRVDSKPWLLHPFPATLDGAASAMPDGVRACLVEAGCASGIWLRWQAVKKEKWGYRVLAKCFDTGNEVYDRYLLAQRAHEAGVGK